MVFGLDLCRALAAVHQAGFLHRDVKAQNVMREAGGRIVLMDFGAADGDELLDRSAAPDLKGTPLYLAPEVFQGDRPSVKSDLYSLGVLLYYLVSGDFPVNGHSLDDIRQRALRTDAADRSATRVPICRPAFVRIVDDATAALPERRPDSAGLMEALLENAVGRGARGSRACAAGASPAAACGLSVDCRAAVRRHDAREKPRVLLPRDCRGNHQRADQRAGLRVVPAQLGVAVQEHRRGRRGRIGIDAERWNSARGECARRPAIGFA